MLLDEKRLRETEGGRDVPGVDAPGADSLLTL
jgi:hypothetical protein